MLNKEFASNPDVDAIYRIINKNIDIKFRNNFKFSLGKAFSPLNSQNTIWSKKYFLCCIYL